MGPGNHVLDGGLDTSLEGAILGKRSAHCTYGVFFAMSSAKTAEPIDLPFGLWTLVGRRKHKFNCIRKVAPMCRHGKAHWPRLANAIEPSVCQ